MNNQDNDSETLKDQNNYKNIKEHLISKYISSQPRFKSEIRLYNQ